MLFIILLGVIAKLAVVSADCNINTLNFYNTVWTNVSHSVTPPNMKMQKRNALTANVSHSFLCTYRFQERGTGCTISRRNIMTIWIVLCPRMSQFPKIYEK
jgi:hypothetical protein